MLGPVVNAEIFADMNNPPPKFSWMFIGLSMAASGYKADLFSACLSISWD